MQTTLRAKAVVTRRGTSEDETYIMVIAPTQDKDGNPNKVQTRVARLLEMDHPNLAQVLEAYMFEGKCFYIMSDWSRNADATYISRFFGTKTLKEGQVAKVIHKLASALLYMKQQGVIHGHLSFEDMHFSRSSAEDCDDDDDDDDDADDIDVKIVDFGVGRQVDPNRYAETHQAGHPEAKRGEFSSKLDVWTLGRAALCLLTGGVRFRLGKFSELAKDFVTGCMKLDPDERLSLEQVFVHDWFEEMNNLDQSCLSDSKIFDALHEEDCRSDFQRLAARVSKKASPGSSR